MTEFKGPIVEGAYYLLDNGNAYQAQFQNGHAFLWQPWARYTVVTGKPTRSQYPKVVRQVFITPTDPAEVVAELRRLEDEANAFICDDDDYREDNAGEAYGRAADLVESMLGLARCGEGCDGNCELTAHGPTKAEAEVAELRAKATEIVTELRAEVADLARHNWNEYIRDRSEALTHAADLMAEKLGVKS